MCTTTLAETHDLLWTKEDPSNFEYMFNNGLGSNSTRMALQIAHMRLLVFFRDDEVLQVFLKNKEVQYIGKHATDLENDYRK